MQSIKLEATDRCPEVVFDFDANSYLIKGESYPEDVPAFFGPLLEQLEAHFSTLDGGAVEFSFELIYFNSSTAKIIMSLFDLLEETAQSGTRVTVNWYYQDGDENMCELGEEFGEELENAKFNLAEL